MLFPFVLITQGEATSPHSQNRRVGLCSVVFFPFPEALLLQHILPDIAFGGMKMYQSVCEFINHVSIEHLLINTQRHLA